MLVFSRKKLEKIIINKNIEVIINEIRGNVVRLGINAPREIDIVRGELYECNIKKYRTFQGLLESGDYQKAKKLLDSLPSNSEYPTSGELNKLETGLVKKYN